MDTSTKKLFGDFSPLSKAEWKEKAVADLKGADFDKKLVWKTDNGFSVDPFYTPEDLKDVNEVDKLHKIFSGADKKWINYIQIDSDEASEANQKAQKATQFGTNGLLFCISDLHNVDFQTLLKDLDPTSLHISFKLNIPSAAFVKNYLNFLKSGNIDLNAINGFIDADILEARITKGTTPDFDELAQMIQNVSGIPELRVLTIRSGAVVDAGGSTKQELAFSFNKLTEYIHQISERGVAVKDIAENVIFFMATSGDYFMEIAKYRALKVALQSVLDCYGADTSGIPVVGTNATWSKSLYDPYVNMLRNTTEAMSAILGGCNAILINPHDSTYNTPKDFSQRIALNISNLIRHESYFDKVIDPAAGSYYIENLTINLIEQSLELFKEAEDKGGFIEAFNGNLIQNSIKTVRDQKEKESATRRRVFVGTNKYPNLNEKISYREQDAQAEKDGVDLLKPQRMTQRFEQLRQRTQLHSEKTGKTPKVYLACFGNPAMRTARASFAAEFFGIGGFEVMAEKVFDSAEQAAKESADSDADIVVICSSDQDYEAKAQSFARTFRSSDKTKQLILAGYPQDLIETLKSEGVDDFIHIKTNVIETLEALQDKFNM